MRDDLDTPPSDEPFALRALGILRRRSVLAFAVFAVLAAIGVVASTRSGSRS